MNSILIYKKDEDISFGKPHGLPSTDIEFRASLLEDLSLMGDAIEQYIENLSKLPEMGFTDVRWIW